MPKLMDKISVKKFIASRLGDNWLTPTIFAGSTLPPLAQRRWTPPFVIKAAHGSSWNIFVRRDADLDWRLIEKTCETWLSNVFGSSNHEWAYGRVPRGILVEPFLGPSNLTDLQLPIDFKFFVFAGRVHYIQVDTDRATQHKRTFFDREWRRQPFRCGHTVDARTIPKPSCLNEMIAAAEYLGKGFSFVRVDLYEINGEPKFGELTFFPDSGLLPFVPDRYDFILGELWPLP
jgi:hypothetical protein